MAIATPVIGETVRITVGKYHSNFAGLIGVVVETSKDLADLKIELRNGTDVWMTRNRVEFGR